MTPEEKAAAKAEEKAKEDAAASDREAQRQKERDERAAKAATEREVRAKQDEEAARHEEFRNQEESKLERGRAQAADAAAQHVDRGALTEHEVARTGAGRDEQGHPGAKDIVPEANNRTDSVAIGLLLKICDRYGIDPRRDARPRELMAWKFYPGMELDDLPDAISLVTAGGLKLKFYEDDEYPMDEETEERLALRFRAFRMDPVTKLPIRTSLPADKTLPRVSVTGMTDNQEHVYKGGYLRRGGRTEAARRAAVARERADREAAAAATRR